MWWWRTGRAIGSPGSMRPPSDGGGPRRIQAPSARRAERLVVTQAIAHLTRVDDRLLSLLWLLA